MENIYINFLQNKYFILCFLKFYLWRNIHYAMEKNEAHPSNMQNTLMD